MSSTAGRRERVRRVERSSLGVTEMHFERALKETGVRPPPVVTLIFLFQQLSAPRMSYELARSLCAEDNASAVLVRLQAPEGGAPPGLDELGGNATAVDWAPSEAVIRGQFGLPMSLAHTGAGFHILTLDARRQPIPTESIGTLLSQLSRQFRYVLVEALADETPSPAVLECLAHSDMAYVFLQAATESVYHLDLLMRSVPPPSHARCARFNPVVCLAEGEDIDGFDRLAQHLAAPIHAYIHGCPAGASAAEGVVQPPVNGAFRADLRRVAREICGRTVGLALSSGAAKGFAHIGVIQVLEENGIEVDVVAGASIGAYIGALWTYGCDGKEVERLAHELEGRWKLWDLMDPIFPPRQGFVRGLALKDRLMRSIGHARFADLGRPLRVVAGNLATLERVAFATGEVAAAVHASVAVPGICVPVTIDGETYIDGGIVEPVPVQVLREMGVARVIAVNVIPTPDRARYGPKAERELAAQAETPARRLFRKVLPVDQQLNYFARGNLFEILMRSFHGAQVRVAEASCRLADLVLRPEICDDRWLDVRHPGRFIAMGRKVAEAHLEEIKALVAGEEVIHEPKLVPEPVAEVA